MADCAKLRKRPSRRHRRRPKNLLTEYARRKRQNIWLETHIWHAKRFHMTKMWGYKIPNYPNDRGVRAAYRDATTRCVIMVEQLFFASLTIQASRVGRMIGVICDFVCVYVCVCTLKEERLKLST